MADVTVTLPHEILGDVLFGKALQAEAAFIRLVQGLHVWERCAVSVLVTGFGFVTV